MYKVIPLLLCVIIILSFTACKKVKNDGVVTSAPSTSQFDTTANVQSNIQSNSQLNTPVGNTTTSGTQIKNDDTASGAVLSNSSSNDESAGINSNLENSNFGDNASSNQSDINSDLQEDTSDDIGITSEPFIGEEDEFDLNY